MKWGGSIYHNMYNKPKSVEHLRYFDLPTPDGRRTSIKHVVKHHHLTWITFYAEDCKPCRRLLPVMEKVYRKDKNKDIGMVAISVGEAEKDVRRFVKRHSISFPVLLDSNNVQAGNIKLQYLPLSFLVDSAGEIKSQTRDIRSIPYLPKRINWLLKQAH